MAEGTPLLEGLLRARRSETWRGEVVRIEVPDEARAAHVRPGQFCRIVTGGATGHFVITTPPGKGPLEFYVQRGGVAADALRALPVGAPVHLSPPQGPGFPVAEALADGGPLYLVATGSGFAALRGALAQIAGAGRSAHVYAGCRQPDDFVFLSDLLASRAAGFRVELVLSRWTNGDRAHRRGYVQDALAADAPDLSRAWVFLCGVPAMLDGVRDVCARLGADPARVLTNF